MMRRELMVFLVVGGLTVWFDFGIYHALMALAGMHSDAAKAGGFLVGTLFAYWANRRWTFGHVAPSRGSWWRFALLYSTTLGTNVLVNALMLQLTPATWHPVHAAFGVATGCSAALNFLGMKYLVFHVDTSTRSV
jgi:putative flippase GtrA